MDSSRKRINVKLVNNEKNYLKCSSKPSFMSHKIQHKNQNILKYVKIFDNIFDNNLVGIRKSKLASKLNKPAYIEMRTLELRKLLMYQFHYDYIKNKYDTKSKLLFTDIFIDSQIHSLMYEIKLKMSMKILAVIKKYLILVITQLSQNTIIQTNQSLAK